MGAFLLALLFGAGVAAATAESPQHDLDVDDADRARRARASGDAPRGATSSTPSSGSSSSSSSWARRRSSSSSSSASREAPARGRAQAAPPADVPIETQDAPTGARLVVAAMHGGVDGLSHARALIERWLDAPGRTSAQAGQFIVQLQQANENSLADWALDHWRAPNAPPVATAPSSTSATTNAGAIAAAHVLNLVQSGGSDLVGPYLTNWIRDPQRTSTDVGRAARDLQQAGHEGLADELLDDWNEHEHTSAIS